MFKKIFGELYIANAVWNELQNYEHPEFDPIIIDELKVKVAFNASFVLKTER